MRYAPTSRHSAVDSQSKCTGTSKGYPLSFFEAACEHIRVTARPTILAIASYFKGQEFLREAKRSGARVLLLTREKLADAAWPMESVDERFLMPDLHRRDDIINAVSYLARTEAIDRIVPLDEFDLEIASTLREHLRIPGMGETTV